MSVSLNARVPFVNANGTLTRYAREWLDNQFRATGGVNTIDPDEAIAATLGPVSLAARAVGDVGPVAASTGGAGDIGPVAASHSHSGDVGPV